MFHRSHHEPRTLAVAAILAVTGSASAAHAQSIYSWVGGSGINWNTAANWFNQSSGGVNGFPTIIDTAIFSTSASVSGGAAGAITVDPTILVTLGTGNSATTTIAGMVSNDGTITFIPDSSNHVAGSIDQRLFITAGSSATLQGAGTLAFNGSETGVEGEGPASTLSNLLGHTIAGPGTIEDISVSNLGSITSASGILLVTNSLLASADMGGISIDTLGTLRLESGAEVRGAISGNAGALYSTGGAATLRDVSIAGSLSCGFGSFTSITLAGVIVNNALITFIADNSNHAPGIIDQRFFIPAGSSASFQGAGTLAFNGSETGIEGEGPTSTLSNLLGHTIAGPGTIEDISVSNHGSITSTSGILQLTSALLASADMGTISVVTPGSLRLENGAEVRGAISGSAGALYSTGGAATLRDVSIAGSLTCGLGNSSSISLAGSIANNAVLTFIPDTSNHVVGSVDQRWFIPADTSASIGGGGSIVLSGSETGFQGQGPTSVLTHAGSHSISGAGTFQQLSIENNGTISAVAGPIVFDQSTLSGNGVIAIAPDGIVRFENNTDVSGLAILGSGGALDCKTGTARMHDLTFAGSLTLGGGTSSSVILAGLLTNNAAASFVIDTSNNIAGSVDQRLFIPADSSASIAGSGFIIFNGSLETGIEGAGVTSSLSNLDGHTITGSGTLRLLSVTNLGTIESDNGATQIDAAAIDNLNGLIRITDDGLLRLENTASIIGGVIDAASGAAIDSDSRSALLRDLAIQGVLTIGNGTASSLDIAGVITNNALATFLLDTSNHIASEIDTRLHVPADSSAAIAGTGRLVLNGIETGIEGDGPSSILDHLGAHTIAGSGLVRSLTLNNHATISPGSPVGSLQFTTAAVNWHPDGRLLINMTGTGTADYGRITGTGAHVLGGTLEAAPSAGYVPALGDSFTIITGSAVSGQFDQIVSPPFGVSYLRWGVQVTPTTAVLRVVCNSDTDNNGTVNSQDFFDFIAAFFTGGPVADFNRDGIVNSQDFFDFLALFFAGC
ncbi:MAG: beta strand repeat-containing protein [Phycisphaerales bacterium]